MTAVQKQLNSIYINNTLTSVYASYNLAHHTEMFPIILELDGALPMFDVDKIPDVIERGEEATRVQVPHIRRLLDSTN
jgi:NTE family protein